MSQAHQTPSPSPRPEPGSGERTAWRIFAFPALLALVGYLSLYWTDSFLRSRRGPWEVTFGTNAAGTPTLTLSQPALHLAGVEIRFPGESAGATAEPLPATIRFDHPKAAVPFGTTAFDDLMYLPGTVVLHCFGHEVQMLPGRLYLNRSAVPWENGSVHELRPEDRLPTLDPPPKPGGRIPPSNVAPIPGTTR